MDFEEQKSEKVEKTWEDTCEQNYEDGFINGLEQASIEIKQQVQKQIADTSPGNPAITELQKIADSLWEKAQKKREEYGNKYWSKKKL